MHVSEIRVNQIRVNQGLGVIENTQNYGSRFGSTRVPTSYSSPVSFKEVGPVWLC